MNNRLTIVLISILLLVFSVFFCCCGIDTSNIAGSASQVYQEEEPQDETEDQNQKSKHQKNWMRFQRMKKGQ